MATAVTISQDQHSAPFGQTAGPCAMTIFGASGDLTKRKLIPALFNLVKASLLPKTLRSWESQLTHSGKNSFAIR